MLALHMNLPPPPYSLPPAPVLSNWGGICVCGKIAADGIKCRFGASHRRLAPVMPPPPYQVHAGSSDDGIGARGAP